MNSHTHTHTDCKSFERWAYRNFQKVEKQEKQEKKNLLLGLVLFSEVLLKAAPVLSDPSSLLCTTLKRG